MARQILEVQGRATIILLVDFHVCIKHLSESDVAGGGAIPVYVCEICIIKAGLSSS